MATKLKHSWRCDRPIQVGGENFNARHADRITPDTVRQTNLAQRLGNREQAAERITPFATRTQRRFLLRGKKNNRHLQFHVTQRQRHRLFVAEIDRANDHTIHAFSAEEIRAKLRLVAGLHTAFVRLTWLWHHRPVPYLDSSEHRDPTRLERNFQHQLIHWGWSLNTARTLFNFRMMGGNLEFTGFNNLANTWGQNVIECPKEGVFLSGNGRVFEFLSRSPARWPVRVETKNQPFDGTVIWACHTENKTGLVVSLLNKLNTPRHVSLDLSALDLSIAKTATIGSLTAPIA
jgi:hypothetical protein